MSTPVLLELKEFVNSYWPFPQQGMSSDCRALSGDAGFRQYYRVGDSPAVIAVDSPPKKERNRAYVQTNLLLSDLGVCVPKIFAVDFNRGYFVLEDLGSTHLQARLSEEGSQRNCQKALEQLTIIQSCVSQPDFVPDYDRALLMAEMNLFITWFVEKLLGKELDKGNRANILNLFEFLVAEALEQPRVLVHRDFHSRNLMIRENGDLAVIDFQDAVWGPITYDLVSLGRDCYLRWSSAQLDAFVEQSADRMMNAGQITAPQRVKFRRWFDLMGLQRHLKVLGIFARLYLRDGKPGYLQDLPLVLRYTLEVLSQYEDCADMATWISEELIPLCAKQDWYRDWQTAGSETELA